MCLTTYDVEATVRQLPFNVNAMNLFGSEDVNVCAFLQFAVHSSDMSIDNSTVVPSILYLCKTQQQQYRGFVCNN